MDRLVHGIYVESVRKYVFERCEPALRSAIEHELPELRGMQVDPRKTYALSYVTRQFSAVHAGLANDDASHLVLKACGSFIAERATSGFLKLLIKVLTPRLFARQFPEFWTRYHAFGALSVDVNEIEAHRVAFSTPSYDYLGSVGSGWIDFVFNAFGCRAVEVTSNARLGTPLPPATRFIVTWK